MLDRVYVRGTAFQNYVQFQFQLTGNNSLVFKLLSKVLGTHTVDVNVDKVFESAEKKMAAEQKREIPKIFRNMQPALRDPGQES